jgi:hypothetical protein
LTLFVDTSVWSLALRRDPPSSEPAVQRLHQAVEGDEGIVTTGLVLQELLQGFHGPRDRQAVNRHFAALPLIAPEREDHAAAAELRNTCRRRGVQLGTIDALIAQLCIRHSLVLLSADHDFAHAAAVVPLRLWSPGRSR